jgi:hypothetical protein
MTDEPVLRLVRSSESEAQMKYVKPSVIRFGAFGELSGQDKGSGPASLYSERRRSVAFLGLLSPNTLKPESRIKV